MNTRETRSGRRNQVLFALSRAWGDEFRSNDIEQVVRKEFPRSTHGKGLNVNGILGDLTKRQEPIIRKSIKGDQYTFTDPRYRMCIRAMLRKGEAETVRRVEMDRI